MSPIETTETVMNEQKKIPGTGRGTGRKPGSKNILTAETKRDIASFFKSLTTENVKWRQNVARQLTSGHNIQEFRFWSRIALEYGFGTPLKMQPAGTDRRSLNFITANGLPWQNDPLAIKEREMLAAQERDDLRAAEQHALEAANPTPAEDEGEPLELVREVDR